MTFMFPSSWVSLPREGLLEKGQLEKDGGKQCEWSQEGRDGSYGIVALAHDLGTAPLTHTP